MEHINMRWLSLLSIIAALAALCGGFAVSQDRADESVPKISTVPRDACSDCVEAAKYLKKTLQDPKILKELEELLDPICDYATTYLGRVWCHDTVAHLGVFVDELLYYLNNTQAFCVNIGFCSQLNLQREDRLELSLGSWLRFSKTAASQQRKPKAQGATWPLCSDCEKAVDTLGKTLHLIALMDKLEEWEEQCARISVLEYRYACQDLFEFTYHIVGAVWYILDDPQILCANLGLCPFKAGTAKSLSSMVIQLRQAFGSQLKKLTTAGPLCDECKKEVASYRQVFASQLFRDSIRELLLEICEGLSQWSYACTEWVNHRLTDAFDYIDKMLSDPEKVCKALQLC